MSEGDWRQRLRGSGYRLTPQRELILAAVERLGHATPDEVLAEVRAHSEGSTSRPSIARSRCSKSSAWSATPT